MPPKSDPHNVDSIPHDSSALPKTKLLHLASDSYRGGAESVFRNTIEQTLTLPEYEIFVASCDTPQTLPKGIDSKHFLALDDWANYPKPIGALKYIFNLKNYAILKRFLFAVRPDIIHTQNYLSRLSPSVLFALRAYKRRFPRTRLIFTQHNFGVCPNGGLYNYAQKSICEACIGRSKFRIMWKNCDRRGRIYSILKGVRTLFYCGIFMREDKLFDKIVCVGEFQRQKHKDDGFNPQKLEVVQNPISMQFYNPDVRLEDKQNLIVFFGRLAPEKNVPLLIEAFARLIKKPEFASYQLCIVGDGEDRARCESLARKLLSPQIQKTTKDSQTIQNITHYQFLGKLYPTQIASILQNAKLAVMPSLWYEGVPLVILESIMAGVLPIGTDIGGIKEGINDNYGFTFRLQDREHLCLVLSQTLENFDMYFENLILKREEILANIKEHTYLKKLIKVYDVIGGGAIILIHSSLIEALLCKQAIHFIGYKTPTEIAQILKHAKLSVVPSLWYETFGLVIVESILAGAVPLVSRIGALKETIEQFCGCSFGFEIDAAMPYEARFLANTHNLEVALSSSLESYEAMWQDFLTRRTEIVQNLHNAEYLRELISMYDLGGGALVVIDIALLLAYLYALYPIVFLDSQSPAHLAQILRYAKCAVMPTKCYETFGLTIAESTLAGAIPIASGIGAYKDTIEQFAGHTFALAHNEEQGNIENLTATMSEILSSYPMMWHKLESKQRRIVQGLLHQKYVENLRAIYQPQH